jgi:hypothetical protein
MIDDSVLAYEKEMNELMGPMGVKTEVSERDSCYYMTVDGSKLYNTDAEWNKKVGKGFVDFVTVFVPRMYLDMEKVVLNETRVEFKIGTLFDMMIRIKEYGHEDD